MRLSATQVTHHPQPYTSHYFYQTPQTPGAARSVAFSRTGATASNSSAIEFPTAGNSWGTITHFAILDASTSGNLLYHGALTASKSITTGDIFRVPSGDLDITLA